MAADEVEQLDAMTTYIVGSQNIIGKESENEESETKISEMEQLTVDDENNTDNVKKLSQISVITLEPEITMEEIRESQLKDPQC